MRISTSEYSVHRNQDALTIGWGLYTVRYCGCSGLTPTSGSVQKYVLLLYNASIFLKVLVLAHSVLARYSNASGKQEHHYAPRDVYFPLSSLRFLRHEW
jgi:hypothetical protein